MRLFAAFVLVLIVCAVARPQTPDPLPSLVKQLQSKKAETRADAMIALAEHGPKAASAVDALARFLPKLNEEERILATMALGKIGKASLPAVEKLLNHEDETTRYYAVWTIALVGKDAHALTPRLLTMLAMDDDEEVRVKLLYTLARIAPDSKETLAVLAKFAHNTDRPAERIVAIEELRHFGVGALKPLLTIQADESKAYLDNIQTGNLQLDFDFLTPTASTKSYESIIHLLDTNRNDAFAKEALPYMLDLLSFAQPVPPGAPISVDDGITFLFSKHAEKLFAQMEAKLKGKNAKARPDAVQTIAQLAAYMHPRGENPDLGKKMTAVLLKCAKDPDDLVRSPFVVYAPLNEDTHAAMEELLFDQNTGIRQVAFSRFQTSGLDGTTKLYAKLREAKGDERLQLAIGLFAMGLRDQETQELLVTNLNHKNVVVRHRIAISLSSQWIFPHGDSGDARSDRAIMRVLIESLKGGDFGRRTEAVFAIWKGKHTREFVPDLLDQVGDPFPEVRLNLLRAIGAHDYGADARASMKKLLPNLDDRNEMIRHHAVFLLAPLHDVGSPHLIRLAEKDPSQRIWELACAQLAKVRPITKDTIPALLRIAHDKSRAAAAIAALTEIDHEGTFAPLQEILMKRDERLRMALSAHPKSTREKSSLLIDALIKDAKQTDLARRRDAMHALDVILPMLPGEKRVPAAKKFLKEVPAQLTLIGKNRKAKDVKVRLESAYALFELRRLDAAMANLLPAEFNMEGVDLRFSEDRMKLAERFEMLILGARVDPELTVRRLARKSDASQPRAPVVGFPFLPMQVAPYMPVSPGLPLMPASIGPGGFGPGVPNISAIVFPPV